MYYDRDGKRITSGEWSRLLDGDYKRVAYDEVHGYRVSTVWLGLDHAWIDGPPVIFETMVFADEGSFDNELGMRRYSTEEAALEGHAEICTEIRKGVDKLIVDAMSIVKGSN